MAKKYVALKNFHHGAKRCSDPGHADYHPGFHVKSGDVLNKASYSDAQWKEWLDAKLVGDSGEADPLAEKPKK